MNINYEFLYSGTKIYDGTTITGLLITDTSSSNTYILQIPLTDFSISEKQAGPFAIDEVYNNSSLVMVNDSTLFQTKSVNPMAEGQVIQPDYGYKGLKQVNVSAAALEVATVKSNTEANQLITPTEENIGISRVIVQKFDGESGNPEAAYKDGDEIYLKAIPAKFLNHIDRVAEFDGYYKAIVSDNNKSYASAQIIYADNTFGPRIPMFDLIGKADIKVDEPIEVVTALTAYWFNGTSEDPLQYFQVTSDELSQTFGEVFQARIDSEAQYGSTLHIVATLEDETQKEVTFEQCTTSPSKDTVLENIPELISGQDVACELIYGGQVASFTMVIAGGPK